MDTNHQDKTGSKLRATEDKLWLPPLSAKDQKKVQRLQNSRGKAILKATGFANKTLWDWLQLLGILAIPVVVVLASILFSIQQSQRSEAISQKQHQTDIQIAEDQQREVTLQTYLDRMAELLLNRNLSKSKPNDQVRNVARAQTLTALRRLDSIRKGLLLQFLNESGLINKGKSVISLNDVDLSGVILSYSHINPKFSNLSSYIAWVNADGTVITERILTISASSTDSYWTITTEDGHTITFNSQGTKLLSESKLNGVDLSGANLEGASLGSVNLSETDLSGADLRNADLRNANLRGSDLSFANLKGASIGDAELMEAKSLQGAIMPDGSIHP